MIDRNAVAKFVQCLLVVLLALSSLVSGVAFSAPSGWEDWPQGYQKFGPRADNVLLQVNPNFDDLFDLGIVDMIDHDPFERFYFPDPPWTYELVDTLSIYQIDLNNQRFPTDNVDFRKALSHLANRQDYYLNVFDTKASPISTPVPSPLGEFSNPNVPRYPYSREQAIRILENANFVDRDVPPDGFREGPDGQNFTLVTWSPYKWGDTGPEPIWSLIDKVIDAFAEELAAVGIASEKKYPAVPPGPDGLRVASIVTQTVAEVINYQDYDFFVSKMSMVDSSVDYLYSLYHSRFMNYPRPVHRGVEGANWVNFDDEAYDAAATGLMTADNWEDAKQCAYLCQEILLNEAAIIPLLTDVDQSFRRTDYGSWPGEERYEGKEWLHAVDQKGRGFDSYWTFLNMHAADYERGGVIRYGTKWDIGWLNPIMSWRKLEWTLLDMIYEPLLRKNPYNQSEFMPWLVESYLVKPWGESGIEVTLHLLRNIMWHDGVPLTVHDVEFSLEYMKTESWGWHYSKVNHVQYVIVSNDYTATIYFDVGILGLSWLSDIPIIPQHIWEGKPTDWEPELENALIGSGPYMFLSHAQDMCVWLGSNPAYFRKLVRPDFYTGGQTIPHHNGKVDLDDFQAAVFHYGEAYPWAHDIDQWADVNKDLVIELDDVMEIGVRYGQTGYINGYPPFYIDDPPPSGMQNTVQSKQLSVSDSEPFASQSTSGFEQPLTPKVYANPPIVTACRDRTFRIEIHVSNVTDLYGWQFRMNFDPNVLNAIDVAQGAFLKTAGSTALMKRINNTLGTITASGMLWPYPSQGASGNGDLATITFHVQDDGETVLHLDQTKLKTVTAGNIAPINHERASSYLTTTIHAAVNWANATDTIYVTAGTYYEHVVINKSLTLEGENLETTIIDGSGTGDVVLLQANNTNIRRFTITNGLKGIHLQNAHHNTISQNLISNNTEGICLDQSGNNMINDNGVGTSGTCGIHLKNSDNNHIMENTISDNQIGLKAKSSNNNTIYQNNFINNTDSQATSPQSTNTWNSGSQGNNWGDYTGQDLNDDGIGDTPYVIDARNKDDYPLMHPWNPP